MKIDIIDKKGAVILIDYDNTIDFWNKIYHPGMRYNPSESIPSTEIEDGLRFISQNGTSIIDYGCGNGKILFRCLLHGASKGCGIDISPNAITVAERIAKRNNFKDKVEFITGGVNTLTDIEEKSYDGAILFNILDNLTMEDGKILLENLHKILKDSGNVLLKLNPFLSEEECITYDFEEVEPNFYIDSLGTFLWNISDKELKILLKNYFKIEKSMAIEQGNNSYRLYYLKKLDN